MRTVARECVFKFIFSKLFNQDNEGLFAHLCNELSDDDKDFANLLLTNVLNNQQIYLDKIEQLSENFRLNRILNTDKCALLIGMAELENISATPVAVAIDEAVKLSAKYSGDRSPDYVNGILAGFLNEVR